MVNNKIINVVNNRGINVEMIKSSFNFFKKIYLTCKEIYE